MTIGKRTAAFVSVLVLSAQAFAVGAGTGWYWPFMDYPMYSSAFHSGDRFRHAEIRVIACGPDTSATRVSWMELRRGYFSHLELAEKTTGTHFGEPISAASRDAARREMTARIREHLPGDACLVEAWARTYPIGPEGLEETDVPWERFGRWPVRPSP